MKKLFFLLAGGLAALIGYSYVTEGEIPFLSQMKAYIDNSEIVTLEARITPQEIIERNKKELLGKEGKSYQEPILRFAPYLLLDVKYLDNQKSREGILLWSLLDGEMVLSADTWEMTHGFHDAIESGATQQDFKLLNLLAFHNGSLSKEKIQKELHLDSERVEAVIEGAKRKHLVTVKGSEVKLHFQDPLFLVTPETKIRQSLVTKPFERQSALPKRYSKGQIDKVTQAAFGEDFKIRSKKEVFLPIYQIQVQNGDGSLMTSYWNALTGKRFYP